MTLKRHLALWILLASAGFSARAQRSAPPEPTDYPAFSGFIAERNIFDPSRRPRTTTRTERPKPTPKPRPAVTPSFSLVGTMDYGKGVFAFFDGTGPGYRKSLQKGGEIAGYRVTEIKPTGVTLVGPATNSVSMSVGMQMLQETDDQWTLSTQIAPVVAAAPAESSSDGGYGSSGRRSSYSSSRTRSESNTSSGPAAPAAEVNDVLKKLMELREKEMK